MVMNSLLKETSSVAQYDKNINMHNKKGCFIYSVQVNWRSKSYQARKRGGAHYLSGHWGLSLFSPSGSVQQHGLSSSQEPWTPRAEEEDTDDVIVSHTQWLIAAAAAAAADWSREGDKAAES